MFSVILPDDVIHGPSQETPHGRLPLRTTQTSILIHDAQLPPKDGSW